jgi:hypothetical protein
LVPFFFDDDVLKPSEWMRLEISFEARSTTPGTDSTKKLQM